MAFLFNLYPSGVPSLYVNRVNNVSGVSAIIDRRTGINEYMMSGVAFFINKIENFINVSGIASSGVPIVSGFFSSIGCPFPVPNNKDLYFRTRFTNSADRIISGIYEYWGVNIDVEDIDCFINKGFTISGVFRNTIFDSTTTNDRVYSYFNNVILDDGNITNLYSGYLGGYKPEDVLIPSGQPQINFDNPSTYPFKIDNSDLVLNDIIVDEYANFNNRKFGIIEGRIEGNDFYSSSGNIIVSGNVSVNGIIDINLDSITDGYLDENIFEFDYHNHDGTNSRQLSASVLDSNRPIENLFDIVMKSGNIVVGGKTEINDIGLYSSWQNVELPNINNIQKLYVLGDKLIIANVLQMTEFGTSKLLSVPKGTMQAGLENISVFYGFGDEVGLFSFDMPTTAMELISGYVINNRVNFQTYPGETNSSTIRATLATTGFGGNFNTIRNRRYNQLCDFDRVMGNTYFSLYESWTVDDLWSYSLYEIDQTYNVRLVGASQLEVYDSNMIFMKPCQLNGCLIMPYRRPAYNMMESFVYDPIYYHINASGSSITHSGHMTWWANTNATSGDFGNITKRYSNDYDYFDGSIFYLMGSGVYRINLGVKNEPIYNSTGLSGFLNLISYGGKLYTGKTLEISYTVDGTKVIDGDSAETLSKITGNTEPWVYNPVIYDGWIYAIAPKQDFTTWYDNDFLDKYLVHYKLPPGSRLVRKRVSEIDFIENQNVFNT